MPTQEKILATRVNKNQLDHTDKFDKLMAYCEDLIEWLREQEKYSRKNSGHLYKRVLTTYRGCSHNFADSLTYVTSTENCSISVLCSDEKDASNKIWTQVKSPKDVLAL